MSIDSFSNSQWYAIGREEDLAAQSGIETTLLGLPVRARRIDGTFTVSSGEKPLLSCIRYGHVWTTLSDEPVPLYDMLEFDEPGRRLVTIGRVSVNCSGPRIVENFLDLAHFPFVHNGILGTEEWCEVPDYSVAVSADDSEIWVKNCRFFQPTVAASAEGAGMTSYEYRVPHPLSVVLYKTCPERVSAWDLVGLFVQPVTEERCDVHSFVLVFDSSTPDVGLLHFQQRIFLQDRSILENQVPRRLPLDPRLEMSTRADASSSAYRRWLSRKGLTYGVELQGAPAT